MKLSNQVSKRTKKTVIFTLLIYLIVFGFICEILFFSIFGDLVSVEGQFDQILSNVTNTWLDLKTFNFSSIAERWLDGLSSITFLAMLGLPFLLFKK
ncbi:TPA: hypothetical protein MW242_002633 [Acinetobacter baumannii]|nr:hypothetical protein [Acinetobacter baumannii]